MKITFIPQRSSRTLSVVKNGESLTINGVTTDFSSLIDYRTWVELDPDNNLSQLDGMGVDDALTEVRRDNGELAFTFALPWAPPVAFDVNVHYTLTDPTDGPIVLPT